MPWAGVAGIHALLNVVPRRLCLNKRLQRRWRQQELDLGAPTRLAPGAAICALAVICITIQEYISIMNLHRDFKPASGVCLGVPRKLLPKYIFPRLEPHIKSLASAAV